AAALGTDTSASIRLPAALCGVVGLKPTYDLLPRAGAFDLSQTLDHVGPMSATVRDNAVLLDALAGQPAHSYARLAGQSVRGRTVGLATGFYLDYLDAPVRQALEQAQEAFRQAGAQVVPIEIAQVQAIYEAQQLVLKTEAYARHLRALTTNAPYQDEVRARLLTGADVLAVDYLQAMAMRTVARRAFDEALAQVDVLLCPTCGLTAPLRDQRTTALDGQEYSTTWLLTRLTAPTNLSGHPSLSVPFGADSQGLPISMQLIGRHLDEAVLYQFGQALEDAA
ncbi:amidase, partial [Bordetella pertussis]